MAQETETPRAGDAALLAARQQATGVLLSQDIQFADGQAGQSMVEATPEPDISVTVDIEVPPELAGRAQELQDRVNRSADKAGAVQQARQELIGLVDAHNRKEAAELAEIKAEASHKAEIAAHHRELYANDHEYQAATDANVNAADGLLSTFDKQQAQLLHLGRQHGITTPLDGAVAEARNAYDDAIRRGEHVAAMQALADMHALAQKQADEYARRLRDAGHHDAAGQASGIGTALGDGFGAAMDILDRQMADYLVAYRRYLAKDKDGLTPEDEQLLQDEQRRINKDRQKALENNDVMRLSWLAEDYERQQIQIENADSKMDGAQEVVSKLSPATLSMLPALGAGIQGVYPTPAPNVFVAAEEPMGRLEMADAAHGDKSPTVITSVRPAIKDSGMTPV